MVISRVLIAFASALLFPLVAAAQTAPEPTTPKAGCCMSADHQASAAQPSAQARAMACCQTMATEPAAPVVDHSAHQMPGRPTAQASGTEAKDGGQAAGCCGNKVASGQGKGHEGMACCAGMGGKEAKGSGMASGDQAVAGCCGAQAPKP